MSEDTALDYGIIGWTGNRGNGKTTGMVNKVLSRLNSGRYTGGYSNLHFNNDLLKKWGLPPIEYLDLSITEEAGKKTVYYPMLERLRADSPNGIPTKVLAIDQIHKYLDSHLSGARPVSAFRNIVIEMRQHGFDLFWTTWARSGVLNIVRKFTEMQYDCYRNPPIGHGPLVSFKYQPIDMELGLLRVIEIPLRQARDIWECFETTEVALAPRVA
jgi:hypothetical protein